MLDARETPDAALPNTGLPDLKDPYKLEAWSIEDCCKLEKNHTMCSFQDPSYCSNRTDITTRSPRPGLFDTNKADDAFKGGRLETRNITASSQTAPRLYAYDKFAAFANAAYCEENFDGNAPNKVCINDENSCRVLFEDAVTVMELNDRRSIAGNVAVDERSSRIIISYRGTASPWDVLTDIRVAKVQPNREYCGENCLVHRGFWDAFVTTQGKVMEGVTMAYRKIQQYHKNPTPSYSLHVVGHSLGGAVATLAGVDLRNRGLITDIITFGSPRVGNTYFSKYASRTGRGIMRRITSKHDIVASLPPRIWDFRHTYPEIWYDNGFDQPQFRSCPDLEPLFTFPSCSAMFSVEFFSDRVKQHSDYSKLSQPCPKELGEAVIRDPPQAISNRIDTPLPTYPLECRPSSCPQNSRCSFQVMGDEFECRCVVQVDGRVRANGPTFPIYCVEFANRVYPFN
ncbi:hypothetical protein QQS21_004759 [Conoideocrella luteorostrata]|uniref:Fungal lipase-type domain-containing protein n=1 Tax=Conoideocrella luteorostrata TaxID=1105319 RepID=A0AAJ0CRR1_9HYPO|nr:hypothetical protein QQS21_004759 [Conoideocrella luteorostrata]